MPDYDVAVCIDGWVRMKVSAASRQDAVDKLRAAKPYFAMVDGDHNLIGELEDSMFNVAEDDIEIITPDAESAYHAPTSIDLEIDAGSSFSV